ncbi:MAG: TolC family protein [Bacteroidales bacterium]|nr:TolC family protein [Bacteroidales bacterium]
MKRLSFVMSILLLSLFVFAQQNITLEECLKAIDEQHPVSSQVELKQKQHQLQQKNIKNSRLPDFSMNAQATYQSDVTEIAMDLPPMLNVDFPEVKQDQYKITADVNQLIYSGGKINISEDIESVNIQQEIAAHAQDMQSLKRQTCELFFNILLLYKQQEIQENQKEILNVKLHQLKAAIKNGAALPSDSAELSSELRLLDQKIAESQSNIQSLQASLSYLTGLDLNNKVPANQVLDSNISPAISDRPEYKQMILASQQMSLQQSIVKSDYYPTIIAFGQAGYGRPGLDMFSDEFSTFYIVGAKVSWKPFDWNSRKRNIEILKAKQDEIDLKQQSFRKSFNSEITASINRIELIKNLLASDREIIALRQQVMHSKSRQLDNGTITSSDYIKAVKTYTNSKLQLNIHKIELQKALFDLKYKSGQLK